MNTLQNRIALVAILLLTAIAGCQTAGPIGIDPLAKRSTATQNRSAMASSATALNTPTSNTTATSSLTSNAPAMPATTNPAAITLVTHEQPLTEQPTAPQPNAVVDNERYVGQYESVGFRNRIQSGLCDPHCRGCRTCRPARDACVSCPPNQFPTPVPCDFPIDPNEYICDGGDRMPDARVLIDNQVRGLGLEDTIVHYETQDGLTYVEPSNRVCLYAPRFAAVRKVTSAVTGENVIAIQRVELPEGPANLDLRQPSSAVMLPVGPERNVRSMAIDAIRDRNRGVPAENVVQPLLAEDVIAVLYGLSIIEQGILREADKPWLAKAGQAAIAWSSEEGPQVVIDEVVVGITTNDQKPSELKIFEVGKGRVRLVKLADKQHALPGEFVHFVLRFDNVGDQPVSNVAILDNLTTRLEYVPDSQTCTKGAIFSAELNEGESLKLRWQLTETLDVGEGCVIRFKCKVR